MKENCQLSTGKRPDLDFFSCDVLDGVAKSDHASMEYPLFTLSTKPDMNFREHRIGEEYIKLAPSKYGLANVHDRDILIYCISRAMAAIKKGEKPQKRLNIKFADLLAATNRDKGGRGYKQLEKSLNRLQGTQIETNIVTGGIARWAVFSFIDNANTITTEDGRIIGLTITLSDWIFNAISENGRKVLTISRDYFRLKKPIERRLYEIARKHCGTRNKEWKFKLETLKEKTGSVSTKANFKRMIANVVKNQERIPDYRFQLKGDTLHIYPKTEFESL